ncbi:hypothetical protein BDF14DRAFT_1767650 [Spinellus fusiger]|nr:hypothetical protein BDF14DRAFT_1767650 [Spinellus fusiger]
MESSRGRGRGRGRGGQNYGKSRDDYYANDAYYDQNYRQDQGYRHEQDYRHDQRSSQPISSRLGPTHNDNQRAPKDRDNYGPYPPKHGQRHDNYRGRGHYQGNYHKDSKNQYPSHKRDHPPEDNNRRGGYHTFGNSMSIRGRGGKPPQRFTRELVDEDIPMDTHVIGPGQAAVRVSGYPHGGEDEAVAFLYRKSHLDWEGVDVVYGQGSMTLILPTEDMAQRLCRLHDIPYRQHYLSIHRVNERTLAPPERPKQTHSGQRPNALEELLKERWDPSLGFLNLDELPKSKYSVTSVISRLLHVAKDMFGESLMTISFARNKFWSVSPLLKLPELFPNLQNLSLQENDIEDFRSLDRLGKRLPHLTELLLAGNPVQLNHEWSVYQRNIALLYPSVKILDQQPIGDVQNAPIASIPGPQLQLPAVKPGFFDQAVSKEATEDFVSKYFPLFDSNRAALLDLYDTQATFSVVSSRTSCAQTTWCQGGIRQLIMGNEAIIKQFTILPPTIHTLAQSNNFMTDAWQVPVSSHACQVVLYLTIHGELREATGLKGARYSFDRSFIIAPAPPNSKAQLAGWQYVILSDSLIVRDYSDSTAFQPIV